MSAESEDITPLLMAAKAHTRQELKLLVQLSELRPH